MAEEQIPWNLQTLDDVKVRSQPRPLPRVLKWSECDQDQDHHCDNVTVWQESCCCCCDTRWQSDTRSRSRSARPIRGGSGQTLVGPTLGFLCQLIQRTRPHHCSPLPPSLMIYKNQISVPPTFTLYSALHTYMVSVKDLHFNKTSFEKSVKRWSVYRHLAWSLLFCQFSRSRKAGLYFCPRACNLYRPRKPKTIVTSNT